MYSLRHPSSRGLCVCIQYSFFHREKQAGARQTAATQTSAPSKNMSTVSESYASSRRSRGSTTRGLGEPSSYASSRRCGQCTTQSPPRSYETLITYGRSKRKKPTLAKRASSTCLQLRDETLAWGDRVQAASESLADIFDRLACAFSTRDHTDKLDSTMDWSHQTSNFSYRPTAGIGHYGRSTARKAHRRKYAPRSAAHKLHSRASTRLSRGSGDRVSKQKTKKLQETRPSEHSNRRCGTYSPPQAYLVASAQNYPEIQTRDSVIFYLETSSGSHDGRSSTGIQ